MDQWKSWLIDIENKRKLRKSQTVFMREVRDEERALSCNTDFFIWPESLPFQAFKSPFKWLFIRTGSFPKNGLEFDQDISKKVNSKISDSPSEDFIFFSVTELYFIMQYKNKIKEHRLCAFVDNVP